MAAVQGTTVRFYVNTGTAGSPVYTAIGYETDCTLNTNLGTIDITNKDSNNWKELIAGIRDWSCSGSAVVNVADAAYEKLKDNLLTRASGLCQFKTENSKIYAGTCFYTNLSLSTPHNGAVTASFTCEGTGALTYS